MNTKRYKLEPLYFVTYYTQEGLSTTYHTYSLEGAKHKALDLAIKGNIDIKIAYVLAAPESYEVLCTAECKASLIPTEETNNNESKNNPK